MLLFPVAMTTVPHGVPVRVLTWQRNPRTSEERPKRLRLPVVLSENYMSSEFTLFTLHPVGNGSTLAAAPPLTNIIPPGERRLAGDVTGFPALPPRRDWQTAVHGLQGVPREHQTEGSRVGRLFTLPIYSKCLQRSLATLRVLTSFASNQSSAIESTLVCPVV